MADPAGSAYGLPALPSGGFDYGMGSGWLPFQNQRDQLLASLYLGQGGLGQGLLGTLQQMISSPTSGPLGLAATAAYGGPQGIASGTGGAGIDNSQYTSLFDSLLKGMSQSVMNPGSPFNPANNGQYNTSAAQPIDPNKAPAPTPEQAAKAPNQAGDMVKAWEAYNPGQKHPDRGMYGMLGGGILTGIPGFEEGGLVGLANAANSAGLDDTQKRDWINSLKTIQAVGQHVADATRNEKLAPWMQQQIQTLSANAGIPQSFLGVGTEGDVMHNYFGAGAKLEDPSSWDPRFIRSMLQQSGALYPEVKDDNGIFRKMPVPDFGPMYIPGAPSQGGRAKGGGVTLGGEPHYIVDSQGEPVAAITEDGKPEHVGGLGGVEVTPLDPMRNALYAARKQKSEGHAANISDMEGELASQMPGYKTGGDMLFPYYPGGKNNTGPTSPGDRTNQIPTFGGPTGTRQGQTGQSFAPTFGSAPDYNDLMSSVNSVRGGGYNERYAKLLGGALSKQNTAIPGEQLASLNAGKAPDKLLSANALGTMAPGQRAAYASLLQQMGIIQSPEDLDYYVDQFRPAGLG